MGNRILNIDMRWTVRFKERWKICLEAVISVYILAASQSFSCSSFSLFNFCYENTLHIDSYFPWLAFQPQLIIEDLSGKNLISCGRLKARDIWIQEHERHRDKTTTNRYLWFDSCGVFMSFSFYVTRRLLKVFFFNLILSAWRLTK